MCVADERNVLIYPEHEREHALVEYGHHGKIENPLDFNQTESFLPAGTPALVRPLKTAATFDVWPGPTQIPSVRNRKALDADEFATIINDHLEAADAYTKEAARIQADTEQAISEYREARLLEEEQRLAELGGEPVLENTLLPHLGLEPCADATRPPARVKTAETEGEDVPDPEKQRRTEAREHRRKRYAKLGDQVRKWHREHLRSLPHTKDRGSSSARGD